MHTPDNKTHNSDGKPQQFLIKIFILFYFDAGKLKSNKSSGPDGIPAEILQIIEAGRPTVLLNMNKACLEVGITCSIQWENFMSGYLNLDSKRLSTKLVDDFLADTMLNPTFHF